MGKELSGKWEMVKLGDVCEIARGGSPRPIDKFITENIDGINWIKIGDTVEGQKYITNTKQKIIKEGVKKSRKVYKGDFLLTNSMSFGKPFILDIDGCIHDGWLVIRDEDNVFSKDYLYYILSSPTLYRQFKLLAVGGVVNNLNSDIVRKVQIPVPPLKIQKEIARNLDLASELMKLHKRKLEELDKLIQSVFYDMFGDPVTNEMGWEVKKLGSITNLKAGKNIKANQLHKQSEINKFPCYGGNGIRGYINQFSHEGEYSLIGRQGALCGNVQFVVNQFYATEHAVIVTPTIKVESKWIYYILKFLDLNRLQTGAAQPGLNIEILNYVDIFCVPLAHQQKFADIVIEIENQKVQVQKSLKDAEMLYNSLMQEYFE